MRVNPAPNVWRFAKNPAFTWSSIASELVYANTNVVGALQATGQVANGMNPAYDVNNKFEDLYERTFYLYDLVNVAAGSRGFARRIFKIASGQLTSADVGYITAVPSDPFAAQVIPVEYTLPTRSDLVAAGVGYAEYTTTSPWYTAMQSQLPSFIIEGYQNSSGQPLKVKVANPTSPGSPNPGDDLAQQITMDKFAFTGTEVYLYAGEYAEFIPIILHTQFDLWVLTWLVKTHTSGYGRVGEYTQMPPNVLARGQMKANGTVKGRVVYPRLWQALQGSGHLAVALKPQGSKLAKDYGDGDGTTTFSIPDLTTLGGGLTDWCLIY